jgi:hypothetical protein
MTGVDSISIPSERIPPVAREAASSAKTIAGVLGFVCVVLTIAMFSVVFDDKDDKTPTDSAERAGYKVGKALSVVLFAGLPGLFAFRAARRGSRATRAADVASADPQTTWRLAGKLVVAERGGAPVPELSFKISGTGRTMLLAVPRAEVVDRSTSVS